MYTKNLLQRLSVIVLFGYCGIAIAGMNNRAIIECPILGKEPVIDGVLDDPVWEKASISSYLLHNNGGQQGDPQTRFRIFTDGKWLYIGIELSDSRAGELSKENLGRDNMSWDEETVEIFISPDVQSAVYYQFAVNPGGGDFDNMGQGSHKDNNYTWKHKEKISKDSWTVEAAILLADLGRPSVSAGDLISLNICRSSSHGKTPAQAWSPTGGMYHNRNAFGTVIIGSFSQAAKLKLTALSKEFDSLERIIDNKSVLQQIQADLKDFKDNADKITTDTAWNTFCDKINSVRMQMTKLAHSNEGLVVWEVNPWQLPSAEDLPYADQIAVKTIDRTALKGEYLTVALAVANMTDDVADIRCMPSDFLSQDWSNKVKYGSVLSVHQSATVALKGGNSYRDPLPLLTSSSPISLPSGRNAVIWLTINTHNINTGQWSCNIAIKPLVYHRLAKSVRLNLTVLPATLHAGPKPYSGNWPVKDLPGYVADQKSHYTNMHTRSAGGILRTIKFDNDCNIISGPDFNNLDAFINDYGTKGQLYIIPDWYDWLPKQLGGGGSWGQKEQDNFTWAVKRVREYFESKGMTVKDFAWYAHDEPSNEAAATSVANFGKLMQAADPQQQVFTTVYTAVSMEALKIMAPYVNLWCPTLGLTTEQREFIQGLPNVRRLSYQVNPRTTDSYWGYRMCATRAFEFGYEGIGFWSYDDGSGTIWDDNDACGGPDYGVVYEAAEGPVSSVRWEAWRQGIQDYRYLEWLRGLAKGCSDMALSKDANALISDIVRDNLVNPDKATADRNNTRARQMVVKLLCKAGDVNEQAIIKLTGPWVVCLTGNSGDLGTNVDTGGSYTYNVYALPDKLGERCQVVTGPVYFKGKNAKVAPQSENRLDGALTDDDTRYPTGYCINWWPPAVWTVTFDLNVNALLSHALVTVGADGKGKIAVSVSDKTEGPWIDASNIETLAEAQKSVFGDAIFDLKGLKGRFVRFDIHTEGKGVRLGEVRIFGIIEKQTGN